MTTTNGDPTLGATEETGGVGGEEVLNATGAKEIEDGASEENQGVEQDHLVSNGNEMADAETTEETVELVKDRADSNVPKLKTTPASNESSGRRQGEEDMVREMEQGKHATEGEFIGLSVGEKGVSMINSETKGKETEERHRVCNEKSTKNQGYKDESLAWEKMPNSKNYGTRRLIQRKMA